MKTAAVAALALGASAHYGKPPCAKDEMAGNIQGANGTLCAPQCDAQGNCPTDVPAGTWKATPQCLLNDGKGNKYCALACKLVGCPTGAHCAMVGIVQGVCVYPNGTHAEAHHQKKFVLEPENKPAAPAQPHLSQAWTAMSKGDGLPGQVGLEHYIYEQFGSDEYALQGHVWDYGSSCKKIELNTKGWLGDKSPYPHGTFYINCDSVDCCYGGKKLGRYPQRPDVKQWDIAKDGLLSHTDFRGAEDIDDLYNHVKQAEHWRELDKLPLARKGLNVTYHYYVTRNSADIISHRIDYAAPGAVGQILYGNFSVQHNVTAHRANFQVPDMCYPQGSGKGHALNCDDKKVEEWEKKYFRHSYAMGHVGEEATIVV